MRLMACLLVMLEHVAKFYRVSVPLFIRVSGYLLLPMKGTTTEFFKRRFTRILFPFILWVIVYSIYFAVKAKSSVGERFRNWL